MSYTLCIIPGKARSFKTVSDALAKKAEILKKKPNYPYYLAVVKTDKLIWDKSDIKNRA